MHRFCLQLFSLSRFFQCESGSYSIIFAFTMIPLFACVGLAVDFGRANSLRDELQRSVDGAVLAAARKASLSETELKAFAETYLAANSQLELASTDVELSKTSTGVSSQRKAAKSTPISCPVFGYDHLELQGLLRGDDRPRRHRGRLDAGCDRLHVRRRRRSLHGEPEAHRIEDRGSGAGEHHRHRRPVGPLDAGLADPVLDPRAGRREWSGWRPHDRHDGSG